MWELLFNGLSIAGSVSSVGSWAGGFTLEKKTREIEASLRRLEELNAYLLNSARLHDAVLNEVSPVISNFYNAKTPNEQIHSVHTLERQFTELRRELSTETKNILQSTVAEMQRTIQSAHYSAMQPQQIRGDFFSKLAKDPYQVGVTQYWDISNGGLWARKDQKVISAQAAPITWGNPFTGQVFLGEIPLSSLSQNGIRLHVPHYRHVVDGHIYSDRHGLYLPSYMIE
jgi:hypothetical protein